MWCQICPAVKPALLAGCCPWASKRGFPLLCGSCSAAHSARLAPSPFCRSFKTIGEGRGGGWLSCGEQEGLVVPKLARYAPMISHLTLKTWCVQMCNQNQKWSETLDSNCFLMVSSIFSSYWQPHQIKWLQCFSNLQRKEGNIRCSWFPKQRTKNDKTSTFNFW